MTTFRPPMPPPLALPKSQLNPGEWLQERLEKEIAKAEEALPDGKVLDVTVILRDGSTVRPTWFGFWGVEGIDERGRKVKVVMHYSALEVVIGTADAPPSGEKRKRSIGFQALEGWPRGKPPPLDRLLSRSSVALIVACRSRAGRISSGYRRASPTPDTQAH